MHARSPIRRAAWAALAPVLASALALAPAPAGAATPTPPDDPAPGARPVGPSARVNTTTRGEQSYPMAARLADGGTAVVWNEVNPAHDSSALGVRGIVLNKDGTARSREFQVNTTTAGWQGFSEVTALSDGRFVVAFNDASEGNTTRTIRVRVFDASGRAYGKDRVISEEHLRVGSAGPMVELADGGLFAAWTGVDAEGRHEVKARVFDRRLRPRTPEFSAVEHSAGGQTQPSMARLSDGSVVIAWGDGGNHYGDPDAVVARRFAASGRPLGKAVQVNDSRERGQARPKVVALDGGRYAVTYMDFSGIDGDGPGVTYRVMDRSGRPLRPEQSAASTVAGYQGFQEVARLGDGGFVVTWVDRGADGTVRARRFDRAGRPVGADVPVNDVTGKQRRFAAPAASGRSGFTVFWEDAAGRHGDADLTILGRRFAAARVNGAQG